MNNNEFQNVGLYDHNAESYRIVKKAYENGQRIVGIVHATGTGKSYNALQLAYDNKNKKVVYVVPSNGIIEHIKKIIEDNPNLDLKRDFPNLEFRTYQSFISLDKNEITNIDCDILILDEFHHIGAPVWGARINTMIETHPGLMVFGMTAYTVRDRGSSYERDMADPDTNELFSGKIVSRYDLCDAMIDGVLPKPIYKSAYTNLIGLESELEKRVQKLNVSSKEYQEYMSILSDVKRKIHEAPSIPNILKKSIKSNGKYIYFCPPAIEDGTNDIETIKKQALEWFKQFVSEENIIFYTTTNDMGKNGKRNRDAFYSDVTLNGEKVDNKLRVMFAINQYNEGIHAPNIDGVIMGRGTTSDIVYFEQLGRALSVRGNTKEMFDELDNYVMEDLIDLCKSRDIPIKENETKESLIQKLIAPVVIDLTNNYDFIKDLENNLRDRIKDIQSDGLGLHKDIKISDASFDIEVENQNLYEMLRYVSDRLSKTWEDMYEFAKIYYEHNGNLEVKQNFKTNNGYTYDDSGTINLGRWIHAQRRNCDPKSERGILLSKIGMSFENKKSTIPWEEMYNFAKIYYEHNGNLEISSKFKTNNGYTNDKKGKINLGKWISNQRKCCNPESERGVLLSKIGMSFDNKQKPWEEMYEFAKIYYEHHGNLEVKRNFKTNDGYTSDEKGKINLGTWIVNQRRYCNPDSERGVLLSKIGMCFENKKSTIPWEEVYELAKVYYEYNGNLEIPSKFKTNDGYTYDEKGQVNLGAWIYTQRRICDPNSERGILLSKIGMRFEKINNYLTWEEMYNYAKIYYEHFGNLEVNFNFKTNNGYTNDKKGQVNLGTWISTQRRNCDPNSEKGVLLSKIGMRFENKTNKIPWKKMYELAKIYYEHFGNLGVKYEFKTNDGYTPDDKGKYKLGRWVVRQRETCDPNSEKGILLNKIGIKFENKKNKIPWEEMYELAKIYYEHFGNLGVKYEFKTNDGYTPDEKGKYKLGYWISNQRSTCNPNSEKGILLSQIGMIWNAKKNKEEINSICDQYNIDYNKNEIVLNHISVQELQAKIEFLQLQNISLIANNGLLHEIFSMSSLDMKETYGLSIEELITEYFFNNKKSKGV